jgi:hypothetical protein
LLYEGFGNCIPPTIVKRLNATGIEHIGSLRLHRTVLCKPRECRGMQAYVDVHGYCVPVLASSGCNRGIDHRCDRQIEFAGNAKEQAEVLGVHIGWNCDIQFTRARAAVLPNLFELPADEICGT